MNTFTLGSRGQYLKYQIELCPYTKNREIIKSKSGLSFALHLILLQLFLFLIYFNITSNPLIIVLCLLFQVERKRHIGNDIVNIVFIDQSISAHVDTVLPTMFDPTWIKSQFTRKPFKYLNLILWLEIQVTQIIIIFQIETKKKNLVE